MLTTHNHSFVIEVQSTHEVLDLNDELALVRRTIERCDVGEQAAPPSLLGRHVVEHFMHPDSVHKHIQGQAVDTLSFRWIAPEQIEEGRKWGYVAMEEILRAEPNTSLMDQCLAAGNDAINHLYRVDYASHMIFRPNGRPVPLAIMYDYINGRIYDGEYDLHKVAVVLLQRDDVVVFNHHKKPSNKTNWSDKQYWATHPKECIMNIPYYNNEEGQTQSVEFIWQPKDEDYQYLWDKVKDQQYPSSALKNSVLSLDFFQLEELASLKQSYHSNKSIKP